MGFYQAQKIEALEARVAELEAKIYQCGLWEDMGPRQADAIVLLTTQVAELKAAINGYEATIEELRMALGQAIKQYQYLLMQYEPEKAADMATKAMEKKDG